MTMIALVLAGLLHAAEVPKVGPIPGEFILSFTPSYEADLRIRLARRLPPRSVPQIDWEIDQRELTRLIRADLGAALARVDPRYEIAGATSVCFFIRVRKEIRVESLRRVLSPERIDDVRHNEITSRGPASR